MIEQKQVALEGLSRNIDADVGWWDEGLGTDSSIQLANWSSKMHRKIELS